jgi:predicted ATPase
MPTVYRVRAATARVRNLVIRANDVADQLETAGCALDSTILKGIAASLDHMYRRLLKMGDTIRDPRGGHHG